MGIDKELLEILVCPKCKGDLVMGKNEESLDCIPCSVRFPIRDDIPVMLIDEALPME
ncbi:MAG: Trm112 family protein [Nitrospinota bacterium]